MTRCAVSDLLQQSSVSISAAARPSLCSLGIAGRSTWTWFTVERRLDPLLVAEQIRNRGLSFVTDDTAPGTLHGRLFNVRVTFLAYPYPNLKPTRLSSNLNCSLASLDDLAAMKLAALSQGGAKKDFVDLYALCRKQQGLSHLLRCYQRRFHTTNIGHLLYSLSYFEDADRDRTPAMLWKVSWPTMKKHIQSWIEEFSRSR